MRTTEFQRYENLCRTAQPGERVRKGNNKNKVQNKPAMLLSGMLQSRIPFCSFVIIKNRKG